MGRKFNPDKTHPFRWHSNSPRCPVCGGRTPRGTHKKCEGQEPKYDQAMERERAEREQQGIDRQFWNHPEAAEQKTLIEQRYGGKPTSIADWWNK